MRHLFVLLLVLPFLFACNKPPPAAEPVRAVCTLTLQTGGTGLQHEYAAQVRARTELRLGQTVSMLIAAPRVAGVIKPPMPAVFPQGGQSTVWLVDSAKMTVRAQPVAVAGADGNVVVIAGGLMPGQGVLTVGVHALTEGQKVRAYAEPGMALPAATTSVSDSPALAALAPVDSAVHTAPAASR
jgi:hypothetical protein